MSRTQRTNIRQGALKERGIDKLLEEAREDNKENDSVYLGKKKCECLASIKKESIGSVA